jgi:hypothetical protein
LGNFCNYVFYKNNASKFVTDIKYMYKIALFLLFAVQVAKAQTITYSGYDRKEQRVTAFEIIGKTGPNFLVFKFFGGDGAIWAYNNNMELVNKAKCSFFPREDVFNVDFVSYNDKALLVYQYQKKNIVYCAAAAVDSSGNLIGQPSIIDTTKISFFASNKIYEFIKSDNKQHLGVLKLQRKNNNISLCLVRFNQNLQSTQKVFYNIKKRRENIELNACAINNKGNFGSLLSESDDNNSDLTNNAFICMQNFNDSAFTQTALILPKIYIESLLFKADNNNERWISSALYSPSRRSNIEGIFVYSQPILSTDSVVTIQHKFSTEFKNEIKGESSTKAALNDFLQRSILIKKDGSVIISAESYYVRGGRNINNGFNDFRNPGFGNNNLWQQDFYTMNNANFYQYQPIGGSSFNSARNHADNIVVTCYSPKGELIWGQVINKRQFEDGSENFISYNSYIIGGQMLYFFNKMEQGNWLINVHSISPDGEYNRLPTIKSLDRGYDFLLRLSKQVNNKTIIVPCKYRNFICFAKIEF